MTAGVPLLLVDKTQIESKLMYTAPPGIECSIKIWDVRPRVTIEGEQTDLSCELHVGT